METTCGCNSAVEYLLPKQRVVSSNLITRSNHICSSPPFPKGGYRGILAPQILSPLEGETTVRGNPPMSLRARLGRTKQSHRYSCSRPIHWAISPQIDFLHFALSLSKSPQYGIPAQAGIQAPLPHLCYSINTIVYEYKNYG